MKVSDWNNNTENRKAFALVAASVAAITTFVVVAQLCLYLSGAGLFALILAAWCAVFIFNYVPVHMLARLRPQTMHPAPFAYALRPIDALAEVKETLLREYFAGKTWVSRAEDKEKKELVFVCRFQEPDITDKGQTLIDLELQLVVAITAFNEQCAVRLDYRLNDLRPSVLANEIAEQTTIAIESRLQQLQEK